MSFLIGLAIVFTPIVWFFGLFLIIEMFNDSKFAHPLIIWLRNLDERRDYAARLKLDRKDYEERLKIEKKYSDADGV
ncbi:hypothetical protein [Actinomyces vulturis]|uniref:hypothetical protein n=1 Tax=Actinomyces vulturis TaxID=1857645 RepID=UPI00082FA2C7|nr:hypothetical protein [Actinomyces vulturis]